MHNLIGSATIYSTTPSFFADPLAALTYSLAELKLLVEIWPRQV